MDAKPEGFTHLYGSRLVEKDNPVIVFRGKLDTLAAAILEAQLLGEELGNRAFVDDLEEIVEFTRSLLSAEYKGTPLGNYRLLGLSPEELREKSHHPERYFDRKHLLMDFSMGPLSVRMNSLRTLVRETELAAVKALNNQKENGKSFGGDIVEALNRLSSLLYILMYKYLPENYSQVRSAGI